jgi:hypothetical protein
LPEVVGDIPNNRALQLGRDVVPAEASPGMVACTVPAVSGQRRKVDAADEGDCVVDDHDLLVMAVHGSLAGIQDTLDLGAGRDLLADRADHLAGGLKHRHRWPRPQQHAHLDVFGERGQDVLQRGGVALAGQLKAGGQVPARDVHV